MTDDTPIATPDRKHGQENVEASVEAGTGVVQQVEETQAPAPIRLPAHVNSKVLKLFASMHAQGVSQHEIQDALDLAEPEFDFILAEPRMVDSIRREKMRVAETKHTTAATWDEIESMALEQVKAGIGDVQDAKDALSIAMAANKADRKRGDTLGFQRGIPLASHNNGVRLPSQQQREAVYERLTVREQQVLEEAPQHIAAVTSVQAVEEFMAGQGVQVIEQDADDD